MLKQLDAQIAPIQQAYNANTPELAAAQSKWEESVRKDIKGLPKEIAAIVQLDAAKRNAKQSQDLTKYFRTIAPELKAVRDQLAQLQQQKDSVTKSIVSTLVSQAQAPRPIRILPRGNWLDDSGEIVSPGVPDSLAPPLVKKGQATRLDLAQWLVAPENPLTARVFVNRLWLLFYGQGLVKTLDDFGSQGAWPAHPELLDWLAVEFRESGWDVKHTIKLMVMARTYKQTSKVSDLLKQRDPFNVLFARQARYRLDAEMIRDNALAISGLLTRKIGGPSVKPYQPGGYWKYLNFPQREWMNDKGESQYRRGLYTYWCRTFLHPSLLAFDAPTREECTVERTKSNTPQQALVLLNDPTYVEAARVFAERLLLSPATSPEQRIQLAFHLALSRPASNAEMKVLVKLYTQHAQQYQKDKTAAEALLRVGDHQRLPALDVAELAAWTSVTRVILNLHETMTRE
jgi:hypothetical protein